MFLTHWSGALIYDWPLHALDRWRLSQDNPQPGRSTDHSHPRIFFLGLGPKTQDHIGLGPFLPYDRENIISIHLFVLSSFYCSWPLYMLYIRYMWYICYIYAIHMRYMWYIDVIMALDWSHQVQRCMKGAKAYINYLPT